MNNRKIKPKRQVKVKKQSKLNMRIKTKKSVKVRKQVKAKSQVNSAKPTPLELILKQKKLNPKLVKALVLKSKNLEDIIKIKTHFTNQFIANPKNKSILDSIIYLADEKNISDSMVRLEFVLALKQLAESGVAKTLPGLIRAVKDSQKLIRPWALSGLKDLAQKGLAENLPEFLSLVKDENLELRFVALVGLNKLAEKKVNKTLSGLLIGAKDIDINNRNLALKGLNILSLNGNKLAQKELGKLKK